MATAQWIVKIGICLPKGDWIAVWSRNLPHAISIVSFRQRPSSRILL